ncbi:MAG: hypothetical protein IKU24_06215 [Clostridia bacterium]|nr:hypothetical protein [Clostridia bacterium]
MKILRWVAVVFVLLFLVLLSADQKDIPFAEPIVEEEKRVPYDYDLSQYITLGDISAIKATFEDPSIVTENEVDNAIYQILLSMASFSEKEGKAERYNKVTIDFSIEQNGEILSEYSQTDYEFVIGLETENAVETVLGEELIGAVVGEERSALYTYPNQVVETGLSGQSVILHALVKKVSQPMIPELIDDWVKENFQGKFETVQEFRESVREDIVKEKEMAKASAVWLSLLEDVRVRSYPEEEIQDYIVLYKENYEDLAEKFQMSLEDLIEVYMEQTMEEFYEEARIYAQEKVKNDMIFTQLVRIQNIQLDEKEYQAGVEKYFEDEEEDFSSLEEFVSYYGEENLYRSILWDKALKEVVDRAVQVNP